MNAILTLLVPAALLFAAPQGAPEGRSGKKAKMQQLDTDGNGTLSAAEVEGTPLAERFASIDANRDGQLSRDEMKAAHQARKAERFAARDANGDGSLSKAEVEGSKLAKHFARIDANGDGSLTPEEMKAAHKSHDGKRGKGKRGKGKGKGKAKGKAKAKGKSNGKAKGETARR